MSVDGHPRPLPEPFCVIATQNPVEYEGTYPLPEAQLDRFLLKVTMPLPDRRDRDAGAGRARRRVRPARPRRRRRAPGGRCRRPRGRDACRACTHVDPAILAYIVELARATRAAPSAALGVSPRGATALLATARAWAWLSGREFVTPDDVQALARPTMRHRIQLRPEAEIEGVTADGLLENVLASVPVAALMVVSGRAVALALAGLLLAGWSAAALGLYALALVVAFGVADSRWPRASPTCGCPRADRARPVARACDDDADRHQRRAADAARPGPRRVGAVGRGGAARPAGDVPRDERRRVVTTLAPSRRGERAAARVVVRSLGPLGLGARQRQLAVPGTVQVLPAFASRRFLPEKLSRLRQIDGAVLVRQRGQGSEFDSLRTYVTGDDVRAIDWRATARSRDVVVRTWRPERDRHVVLGPRHRPQRAARVGDEPRLDAALDACLLLGALSARAGDRVALVAADVEVRARLGLTGGRDVLPRLVGSLAAAAAGARRDRPAAAGGAGVAAGIEALAGRAVLLAGHRPPTPGCCRPRDDSSAGTRCSSPRRRTPHCAPLAAARDTPSDVYTAAAAAQAVLAGPPSSSASRRPGCTWCRARPTCSPRRSPTPTSTSRPPGGSDAPPVRRRGRRRPARTRRRHPMPRPARRAGRAR